MTEEIKHVEIEGKIITTETLTLYGYPTEFVEIDGVMMMRSNSPFGTWPIVLLPANQNINQ